MGVECRIKIENMPSAPLRQNKFIFFFEIFEYIRKAHNFAIPFDKGARLEYARLKGNSFV